jgi:iron complex outermembrane recepter protein
VAPGAPRTYDPDKTSNYELGLKADAFDHLVSFDASVYYIDWRNIQLGVFNGQGYTANASRAKSQGVEFSVQARPVTGMKVGAWVSWDEAELTEGFPSISNVIGNPGDRLPLTPHFSSNFSIDQQFPLGGRVTGFVGATLTYIGDRVGVFTVSPTVPRITLPSFARGDLRAGATYDTWTASFFANNVADRRGELSGPDIFNPAAFQYIQPRTVGLSLVKTF